MLLITNVMITPTFATLSLYTIPPTKEQEKLGTDENGDKKAYTDCEGYDDLRKNQNKSKKDADFDTEAVDKRVIYLRMHEIKT